MRSTELAWAAGLFDGEGCTAVHRQRVQGQVKYRNACLNVSQNDRGVLDRFARVVGVGGVYGPRRNKKYPKRKAMFCFAVCGSQLTYSIIARIWPWLSEAKRQQAIRVFDEVNKHRRARARGGATNPREL